VYPDARYAEIASVAVLALTFVLMGNAPCRAAAPPAYEPCPDCPKTLAVLRLRLVLSKQTTLTEAELIICFTELLAAKVAYAPVVPDLDMPTLFALVDTVLSGYDPYAGRCVADINPMTLAVTWLDEYPDPSSPTRMVARHLAVDPPHRSAMGCTIAALSSPPSPVVPPRAIARVLAERIALMASQYPAYTLVGDGDSTPFEVEFMPCMRTRKATT